MFRFTARTILELGSELISSDIIAFYELIKNAFDAKSPSGADVHFCIVMRRNSYLLLRQRAETAAQLPVETDEERAAVLRTLAQLKADVARHLDTSADLKKIEAFLSATNAPIDIVAFLHALDESYATLNTITVADTGSGMDATSLDKNYLTIGTSSRKREVDEAIKQHAAKPPFLGEKGIGRLAAMRLGQRLRVETATSADVSMNVLDINWKQFDDIEATVDQVLVSPEVNGPKAQSTWSGTRIVISDLNEDWTSQRLQRMACDDFAGLTDPFVDPKNRPRIALHWNGNRVSIPWMDRILLEHAHATLEANFDCPPGKSPTLTLKFCARNLGYKHPVETKVSVFSGADLVSLVSNPEHQVPADALDSLGSFKLEAFWYNRRYLTNIDGIGNLKLVRDYLRRWTGIRVYRDGFRVFPYGQESDDWIGLDRVALGRRGYILNKNQFVGRVLIGRTTNSGLVDQTNREGFRGTPEQACLVSILSYAITDALWNFLTSVEKQYKDPPIALRDVALRAPSLQARAQSALGRLRAFVPKEEEHVVSDLQLAISEFNDLATKAQQRIEQVEEDSKQMLQMAGVGLMVEVIAHELARATESALAALDALRGKDLPADTKARLETLRSDIKSVTKRLRVLDELSVSGRQRSEEFDLVELILELKEGHAAQFEREGIRFMFQPPSDRVRVRLVKGMVIQILENLLSNSLYWMQLRAKNEPGYKPTVTIEIDSNPLAIRFSDNGPGISPDNRDSIFDAFWSLKEKAKRRGLGLYIARENATHLGGALTLSDAQDPIMGRLHHFVLELPNRRH